MSEKGKDRLFIAYANYSLRVDPKNFFKIVDVGDRCLSFLLIDKKRLRAQVEAVIEFALSKKPDVRLIRTEAKVGTKNNRVTIGRSKDSHLAITMLHR